MHAKTWHLIFNLPALPVLGEVSPSGRSSRYKIQYSASADDREFLEHRNGYVLILHRDDIGAD
jgi:hypothetical protein